MTQRALAEQLGLSAQQISNYENGRAEIPQQTVLALQALGIRHRGQICLHPQERALLTTYMAALRRTLGRELLFALLFGSKVRGEATAESDIDLCLIVQRKSAALRTTVFELLFAIDPTYAYRVAPVIYSLEEYQANEALESPFIAELKQDGVLI